MISNHGSDGFLQLLINQHKEKLKIFPSFIELETGAGIALHDITPHIGNVIEQSAMATGFVTVTSQHTTTAIVGIKNKWGQTRLIEK